MYYRGALLRLDGGRLTISSNDVSFPPELNYGENTEFLRFFVLSYVKLLSDSPLFETNGDKPRHVYMTFLRRLTGSHLSNTIKLFSGYAQTILDNEYGTGGDSSTRVFHSFMRDTPIFKEYHTWLSTGRPELLQYILSFLQFGKKLEYEDPEFNATAFRGWLEVEEKLRTLVLDSDDVSALRNIIDVLLPPLQIDHLLPRFGPGKVAEPGILHVYDKLGNLSLHRRVAYAYFRERPGRSREHGFGNNRVVKTLSDNSRDFGRQKYVWKDIHKSRSIGMEPNLFMYFQQEVMRWLVNSMSEGLISRFVSLDDQTPSQDAARHGSMYYSTDTIDLSSASDSVSMELVRRIFPADYLFHLLSTRTSHVEIPGFAGTRQLMKFAPMGSAVCFPVQCIIFTAVCVYAAIAAWSEEDHRNPLYDKKSIRNFILKNFHRKRTSDTPFTRRFEPPVVYGDDIAVDTRTTEHVISTLTRLGFSVNRSKSFTGSQSFRESCGVFAFEGHDVTPLLFRLPLFNKGPMDAKVFASFIGSINYANDGGYHSFASFLTNALKDSEGKYPVPFVTRREEFGIFTTSKKAVADAHLRYNAEWQVHEERMQGIGPRKHLDKPDDTWITLEVAYMKKDGQLSKKTVRQPSNLDDYRYDQWWRSKVRGHTLLENSRSLRIAPQETRLAPRWARRE